MANIVFPTSAIIANTIPENGNTVPITGAQAITNHSEMLAYSALAYANIYDGDTENFGTNNGGILPICRVTYAQTEKGQYFLQIYALIPLVPNYAMFPDGKKLHKQVRERRANIACDSAFNF